MNTTEYSSHWHISLGYLGLLPFICLIVFFHLTPAQPLVNGFQVYSLSILAFICGSMWRPGEQPPYQALLLIAPYFLIPIAWFTDKQYSLLLLTIIYPILYLMQTRQGQWSSLTVTYQRMRLHLTLSVSFLHLLLFWLMQSRSLE